MQLPPAIFDEITGISELPPPADEAELFERREHHRLLVGSRATICNVYKGVVSPPVVVLIRDISIAGVGILHAEKMKPGDVFIIRFPGRRGNPVRVQCVACRCELGGIDKTHYVIGATFERVLETTDADLPATPAETAAPREDTENTPVPAAPITHRLIIPSASPGSSPSPAPAAQAPVADISPPQVEEGASPVRELQPIPEPGPEDTPSEAASQPPLLELNGSDDCADQDAAIDDSWNRQVLAKVKARLLSQGQLLQDRDRRLEECNRQLGAEKAAAIELRRQRDQATGRVEGLQLELADMKRTIAVLEARIAADGNAVAELAHLLGIEPAADESAKEAEAA